MKNRRNKVVIPGAVVMGLATTILTPLPALAADEYEIVCGDPRILGDLDLKRHPIAKITVDPYREGSYCYHY